MEARTQVALRWADLDRLGHVNQAVYHVFLEEARAAMLEPMGHFSFVLAHVEMDFRREVRRDRGHVDVVMRTTAVGRSSVTIDHQILLPDGGVAAEGRSVLVAWDPAKRCAVPLTEQQRAFLT